MRDEPKKRMRVRIIILLVCFYLGFMGIAFRTYQLQVIDAARLQTIAKQQYQRRFALKSPRGVIYDRNHAELAVNKRGYSIARTERVKDPRTVALKLARVLGSDEARLERKLKEEENFVWLERQVSEEQGEAIKVLAIPGIMVFPEERRYYPGGDLAGQILGFTGLDGEGLEGMEKLYDRQLRGKQKFLTVERDNRGALMMFVEEESKRTQPASLQLTLDQAIQHLAEEKVREMVLKWSARRGALIAMDPRQGKIIALAMYPGFDPNRYAECKTRDWRNWPLNEVYEPGSTFKVVTFSSAIDEHKVKIDDQINCENGSYAVNGDTIHDMHKYGILTAAEVLSKSSNIGASKVAERMGPTMFQGHILDFGFGARTGIDFPGEAKGLVRPLKQWYPITLHTIGFGQGISVTPLQMLVAMSAVANGGEIVKPYLAEKLIYPDGSEQIINRPTMVRKVISPETSAIMTQLMVKVVNEGTGKNAKIEGYQTAGKTGTAQKARLGGGGYDPSKWVCSFMGFAPADNPQIAMIVLIDEPAADYATGGMIAAPVFQEVTKYALTTMGVLPESMPANELQNVTSKMDIDFAMKRNEVKPGMEPGKLPDFRGLSLKDALKLALELGQKPQVEGTGWVVAQDPAPGSALSGKLNLKLNMDRI